MTILIGDLEFEGPITDLDMLSDEPGLYAILCQTGDEYELVELGDTDHVRQQLIEHEQRELLQHEINQQMSVAVHYTADITAQERHQILESLEREFEIEVTQCCA